jgi:hypothetical protein
LLQSMQPQLVVAPKHINISIRCALEKLPLIN